MELTIIIFAAIITSAIHFHISKYDMKVNLIPVASWLMFFTLFLEIIPIYRIRYLPITPNNLVYCGVLLLFFLNLKTYLKKINKYIVWIIGSYFLYHLIKFIIRLYLGMELERPYFIIRNISFFLIFIISINEKNYSMFLKIFTFLLFLSMSVGIFIYLFGEPFASLRMKILNDPNARYFGEGIRIAGFTSRIFTFGYQLTALPILIFTFYKKERNFYWLIMLFISIFGLLLNAEKATMIFSGAGIIFLSFKWFKGSKKFLIFISLIIISIAIQQFFLKDVDAKQIFPKVSSTFTRFSSLKIEDVYKRLGRQYAAILSVLKNPLTGGYAGEYYEDIYYKWFGSTPRSPHSSFIRIGVRGGILAWLLFIIFAFNIIKIIKIFYAKVEKNYHFRIIYQGVLFAFLGPLGVGLFHSAGIFDGEITALILLGFLIAGSNLDYNFISQDKTHT